MDFNFGNDIVHVKLKYVELSDVQQNSSGLLSSSSGWKTSARFPPNLQTKCQNHNQLIHVLWICWNWSDIWLRWIMCIKSWHRVISVGSMGCIVEIFYCRDEFAIPILLKYGMEAWQQPADCIMGKWSCDQSLKRWFSGNQSWAGISSTEHEQLGISLPDSESQGTSNQLSSLHLWSFDEMMKWWNKPACFVAIKCPP